MKKSLVVWLVFLLIGIGGYFVYRKWFSHPPKTKFETQTVERGDLTQVVNATGTLQPVVLSPVGAQVSGIVWKIHSDYNDLVKKGQVLVELDPALFKVAVAQQEASTASARADVESAKASLYQAQVDAVRSRTLEKQKFIATADKDAANAKEAVAQASLAAAKAKLRLAQAALDKARLDLKNSVVLSPVDGSVISRNIELGQAVVASFQAPNLFTIAENLKKMQVLANVDEADIGMVKEGAMADFTVDSFRNRHFNAKVSQIRNAAQTLQNVVTYVVVLDVDNSGLLLRPGMTANVKIEVANKKGIVLVPNPSLRFKPKPEDLVSQKTSTNEKQKKEGNLLSAKEQKERAFGLQATVYVQEGEKIKPLSIITGITDGNQTEVKEGLREGQQVVVDAIRPLGSKVAASNPSKAGGARRAGF